MLKSLCLVCVLFVLSLSSTVHAEGKASPYVLGGSVQFEIESKYTGKSYVVTVGLPGDYGDEALTFPVLYILDAQWQYPMFHTMVGSVHHDGDMPDTIMVGLQWKEHDGNLMEIRSDDLDLYAKGETGAKAEVFRQFLKLELFPFIEKKYRTNNIRAMSGGSLTSAYLIHSLLREPESLDYYIVSSPALYRDIFDKNFEPSVLKAIDKDTRVYICKGSRELYGTPEYIAKKLKKLQSDSFKVEYLEVSGSGHAAVNSECYNRGLQFAFYQNVQVKKSVLKGLAGIYKSEGENLLEFSAKSELFLLVEGKKVKLNAKSPAIFYAPGLGMEFHFSNKGNKKIVTQFSPYAKVADFIKQ